MREIKFRAWDKGNKIMHYDFEFIRSGTEGNDWIIFKSDKQRLDDKTQVFPPLQNPYFAQQLKIMQYTGLKDCTGKEIYDGDIVSVKGHSHADTFINKITFKRGGFWIDRDYLGNWKEYMFEVIGNVFENPELLEVKI